MKNWIYLLLIILSFILYGNSINNDYALDDEYVTANEYVQQGIIGIPNIITHRYGIDKYNLKLDYRPVVLISFAIEHQFFGNSPHISHFVNIILYALCLIVLYNILISIFSLQKIHEWLPLVITFFYAIHPIHTEVVNSIKNRDELFGFLFGLLFLKYAFTFLTIPNKKIKYSIYAVLFFILTLLSKLIGIIYFPLLILILIYNKKLKWNKRNYLFISICLVVFIFIPSMILNGLIRKTYSFENALVGEHDIAIIISTCFKTIIYHIKMLLMPYPLRYYYGFNLFPIESKFEPVVLISIILHLSLLVIGIIKFIKKDVIGLFILCYLASILLYFNFPIPYPGMFSERALFLSSAWFISIIFIIVFRLLMNYNSNLIKYSISIITISIFIGYSYQTIQRNFNWKNKLTLLSHDMPNLENSVTANYLYANVLKDESNKTADSIYSFALAEKAASHYQQAINLYPYYPDYFYQLAMLNSYKLNNVKKAEMLFSNMQKIDSNFNGVNYELGKIYFDKNDFRTSYPYLKKAYLENPTDSLTLFYVAQNALKVGDYNTCYNANNQFIKLYPNIKYPYLNLGVYYSTILKDDSAVIYFEKGIALGDRNPDLIKNIVFYFDKKQNKEKSKYYEKMLEQIQ